MEQVKQAVLYESLNGQKVRCCLCNFNCVIADGQVGHCAVRKNIGGVLYSLVYDKVCSAGADPIEKKPLFHFQPGSWTFSIATCGCNFQCDFCQNWQISQRPLQAGIDGISIDPEKNSKRSFGGWVSITGLYVYRTYGVSGACIRDRKDRKAGGIEECVCE